MPSDWQKRFDPKAVPRRGAYDDRHLCRRCYHHCRTGSNRDGSPYWGSCGNGVEPGQRLKAGLPVFECYGFKDLEARP